MQTVYCPDIHRLSLLWKIIAKITFENWIILLGVAGKRKTWQFIILVANKKDLYKRKIGKLEPNFAENFLLL